jgi:hypothetical protein
MSLVIALPDMMPSLDTDNAECVLVLLKELSRRLSSVVDLERTDQIMRSD